MKLSEIQQWLSERGIRLTKSLGQNLLHDGNQLRRIVRAAELQAGDRVLEIGPGLGALTGHLLAGGARVLAIEKDQRLAQCLQERFGAVGGLELVEADAVDYLKEPGRNWAGWKLVSNLPYSVGSPILVELALNPTGPDWMVATLQLEVIERLAARAGDGNYGLLSVLVGLNYAVTGWFKVPARCFFPVPDVDSACVTLVRREPRLLRPDSTENFVRHREAGLLATPQDAVEIVTAGLAGGNLGPGIPRAGIRERGEGREVDGGAVGGIDGVIMAPREKDE